MGTPIRLILVILLIGAVIVLYRRWSRTRPGAGDKAMTVEGDRVSQPAATEPRAEPLDMPSDTRHETEQADYGA